MSDAPRPVSVNIMDKEYLVACTDGERESLFKAVEYLNRQMKELRDSGKIIGTERVAVLAALNIANEYQEYKRQKEGYTSSIGSSLKRIQSKIAGAIMKGRQMDMTDPVQGRLDA
jgi:cell division protein ZapA